MALSPMDSQSYYLQPGRVQHQSQHHIHDLTPCSAVSSFNLPAQCNSSLVTPVSPGMPPLITRRDVENSMSPLVASPNNYRLNNWDSESCNPSYHRLSQRSSNGLNISTSGNSFPSPSYMNVPEPYFGEFGVSATSGTAQRSLSSPRFQQSPHLQSTGGISNSSPQSLHHSTQDEVIYRSNIRPPTLIAPNPLTWKQTPMKNEYSAYQQDVVQPAMKQEYPRFRKDSISPAPLSPQSGQSHPRGARKRTKQPQGLKGRKGKGRPQYSYEALIASGDLNEQERVLLKLRHKDNLPWKEIEKQFNLVFGTTVKDSTLQMRKTRLINKLRVCFWTAEEERALSLSVQNYIKAQSDIKWQFITENMQKHGGRETWSKQEVQTHYQDLQAENIRDSVHDIILPNHRRVSSDSSATSISHGPWSDQNDASENEETWTLVSAASTVSMDEVRSSSTASVANLQQQYQQTLLQQQQQALIFGQQDWESGA